MTLTLLSPPLCSLTPLPPLHPPLRASPVPAPAVGPGAADGATPEEEEPFELPTLEEVARATGTLRSEPIGESVKR